MLDNTHEDAWDASMVMGMGLEEKPGWSKSTVDRLGETIRAGDQYDQNFLDDFLDWHAGLIDTSLEIISPRLGEFDADLSGFPSGIEAKN